MNEKNKKLIFVLLIIISTIILILVGSTFAYFSVTARSAENAITVGAATFSIDLTFDKPFMFIIRDKDTQEVWFSGTVYEPTKYKEEDNNYMGE